MFNDKSFFGSDFKYLLILTLLAWITYTLPSVRAALEFPIALDGRDELAQTYPYPSPSPYPTPSPYSSTACPAGYVCIPSTQYPLLCKTASIVISANPASPAKTYAQISSSTSTEVVLAVYNISSQSLNSTLRALSIGVVTSKWGALNVFGDIRLKIGSTTYSATAVGTTTSWRSLAVSLPAGAIVPMTIYGIVRPDPSGYLSGAVISTVLQANAANVKADDGMNNPVSVTPGTFTSNERILASDILVNNTSAVGQPIIMYGELKAYEVAFSFTLTAGQNTLYIYNEPSKTLISTLQGVAASTTWTRSTTNPLTLSGDDAYSWVIPAGTSRSFIYHGVVHTLGQPGPFELRVTGIRYRGDNSGGTASQGLEYLIFRGSF